MDTSSPLAVLTEALSPWLRTDLDAERDGTTREQVPALVLADLRLHGFDVVRREATS